MSALQVIDSHFHAWDLQRQSLAWLEAEKKLSVLRRDFSIAQLIDEYQGVADVELKGLVHIEADTTDAKIEDSMVLETMARTPELIGAVTRKVLSRHIDVDDRFVGVREVLHNEDIPRGRCLEDSFLDGLSVLAETGQVFEAVMREHELNDLWKACSQVPQAVVVVNQCGNVTVYDQQYESAIKNLASLPNVYCKVSGLSVKNPHLNKKVLQLLEAEFSRKRLLYASNWPVMNLYSSFQENLDLLRDHFEEDPDVFANNAKRVYKLKG